MMRLWLSALTLGLVLVLSGGPAWAEVIAYPKKGQTQEQFQQDQYQCHQWAKGQTGSIPWRRSPPRRRLRPSKGRGEGRGPRRGPRAIGGPSRGTPGKARLSVRPWAARGCDATGRPEPTGCPGPAAGAGPAAGGPCPVRQGLRRLPGGKGYAVK